MKAADGMTETVITATPGTSEGEAAQFMHQPRMSGKHQLSSQGRGPFNGFCGERFADRKAAGNWFNTHLQQQQGA